MAVARHLLVIIGPTASGKSAVAMELARRVAGEILSVDSMQVYKGMDIGTAKPTREERREVPHWLIDVVEPTESFTVARFVEMADQVIGAAAARGGLIATGGTPLYYKALFEGLFEGPSADVELRSRLSERPGAELHRMLQNVDPVSATRIHANDVRRLVRALEVYQLTGQPISSFQTDWARPLPRHRAVWVGLRWEKEALNRRINARVKAMMEGGWLEETRALVERYGELSHDGGRGDRIPRVDRAPGGEDAAFGRGRADQDCHPATGAAADEMAAAVCARHLDRRRKAGGRER